MIQVDGNRQIENVPYVPGWRLRAHIGRRSFCVDEIIKRPKKRPYWFLGEQGVFSYTFKKTSIWLLLEIQYSAVLTLPCIAWYYLNNYKNWGRISSRCWCWIHKSNPYLAFKGELWGVVSIVNICEKNDCVITAPHCKENAVNLVIISLIWITWYRESESSR